MRSFVSFGPMVKSAGLGPKAFGFPADGESRGFGTVQDITSRKQAEMKISEQLDAVEAARAEAEALRKATLALSQNLAMDSVLDTLLLCISDLVPFDRATILFVETGFDFMVAREAPRVAPKRIGLTLGTSENKFLERILFEKRAVLVSSVATEPEWTDTQPLEHLQSWLGVPLVAAGQVLGILSLGSSVPAHVYYGTSSAREITRNPGGGCNSECQDPRAR